MILEEKMLEAEIRTSRIMDVTNNLNIDMSTIQQGNVNNTLLNNENDIDNTTVVTMSTSSMQQRST